MKPHKHKELEYGGEANRNAKPGHPERRTYVEQNHAHSRGEYVVSQFEAPFTIDNIPTDTVGILSMPSQMLAPLHVAVWVATADAIQKKS